jgi:NADP-dependent 3-hydroxy acid dehydrogenase YdfG
MSIVAEGAERSLRSGGAWQGRTFAEGAERSLRSGGAWQAKPLYRVEGRLMANDDPVLLITGASTGIGAATARLAADQGYRLVLAARSEDKLQGLARELGGDERAIAVCCDVSDWSDQESLVRWGLDAFGRLDAAFANAGFGGPRGFEKHDPEEMRAMVLTNVLGAAYTIRATMPHLRETQGHLILTSSVAGRRALPGSLYSATKFAVTAMGEAARQDLNGSGCRVTLIEPGMVDTPFFENGPDLDEPLHADDVARAVLYALAQPRHVDVNEILMRPTSQDG